MNELPPFRRDSERESFWTRLERQTGMGPGHLLAGAAALAVILFGLSRLLPARSAGEAARQPAAQLELEPLPEKAPFPAELAAPRRAGLNAEGGSSSLTTIIKEAGQEDAGEGAARAGASFEGRPTRLSQFLTGEMAERARQAGALPAAPEEGAQEEEPAPAQQPRRTQRRMTPLQSPLRGGGTEETTAAQVTSGGTGGGSGGRGSDDEGLGLSRQAAQRAGRLAGELPGVPEIGPGVRVGAPPPNRFGRQAAPGRGAQTEERPQSRNGKVEGPVVQQKTPEVGPGVQVNNVQSAGNPSGVPKISNAGNPDILSVPVDVNRIQLDPNKSNDVDRAPGINTIGK